MVLGFVELFGYKGGRVAPCNKSLMEARKVSLFGRLCGVQAVASERKGEGDGTFGMVGVGTGIVEVLHVIGGFDVEGGF